MAVDAVTGVTPTTTTQPAANDDGTKVDYTKMTPAEILEAEKNGATIPSEILQWAKENPDSTSTYAESQGGETGAAEENDAVAYSELLDSEGVSLKTQCKIFTTLSAYMEKRDLANVTKMAPYTQQIPTDEQSGEETTSEVEKVLGEIALEVAKSFKGFSGGKEFRDGIEFFSALCDGASSELIVIDESLSEMQDVLDEAMKGAKQSKQFGEETILLGQKLKSNSKWWRFGRKRVAKKAIEQGDLTVKMSERTNKLAEAIAKDNEAALKKIQEDIDAVENAEIPEVNELDGINVDNSPIPKADAFGVGYRNNLGSLLGSSSGAGSTSDTGSSASSGSAS